MVDDIEETKPTEMPEPETEGLTPETEGVSGGVEEEAPPGHVGLYFEQEKTKAPRFARELGRSKHRKLEEAELQELAERIHSSHTLLGRLVELVLECRSYPRGGFLATQASALASAVLAQAGVRSSQEGALRPMRALAENVCHLNANGGSPSTVFSLKGLLLLSELDEQEASDEEVLVLFQKVFRNESKDIDSYLKDQETTLDARRRRPADVLFDCLTKAPRLDAVLEVSEVWAAEFQRLSRAEQEGRRERERISERLQDERRAHDETSATVERLTNELAERDAKIVELQEAVRANTVILSHKADNIKARLNGMLGGRLSRWLQTAHDAATADPPSIEVVIEKLELALNETKEEIAWLEGSSD